MYNLQIKNIPKLRFPQFSDDWKQTSLTEIAGKGKYGMNSAAKIYDGKNKYLRITDIDDETRSFLKDGVTSPTGDLDDDYILRDGDFVLARTGASTGKTYMYKSEDEKMYFAGFLIRFRVRSANPYFIYTQTLRQDYKKWVELSSARSGQPGINAEEFGKYKFYIPDIGEQQKIADFLTAVDDRISGIQKKVELLKKYKKGVIKKIFSQEIRFKEKNKNDYSDWETKKLKDLGNFYRGHTYNARNVENSGYLVLRSTNIQDGTLILDKDLQFVNKKFNQKISLQKNDIVICMANGSRNLVGKTAIYKGNYKGEVTVGAFCSICRGKSPLLKYLFQTMQYKKYLHVLLSGSNINNLSNTDLANLEFLIPQDELEQHKIVDLLSSIDDKVLLEERRLAEAKKFKKSLLQQMFV
jgi:type I restriction enzyme S subunit